MSPTRSYPVFRAALTGSLLALLASTAPAAAADPGYPFAPAGAYATDNRDLRSGDLDGDGAADLVTFRDADAQVLLGDGSGGFGPPATLAGLEARTLELADLNGDRALDIVTADPVRTWIGDGSGGFAPAAESPVAGRQLGTGDFTGDGNLDVVVAADRALTLLPGDGAGGFSGEVGVPVDLGGDEAMLALRALAVGDADEDSHLDVLLVAYDDATRRSAPLIEMLGDGAGGFAQAEGPADVLDGAQSLTFADLDGDGHGDLVSTDANVAQGGGSDVIYGDGAGGFARAVADGGQFPGLFTGATRPALADFDGDGLLDLAAVADGASDPRPPHLVGIALALGTPARDFAPPLREDGPRALSGLEASDFAAGPLPDLAVIRLDAEGRRRLEIHLNAGGPEPRPLPNPGPGQELEFALEPAPGSLRAFVRKGAAVRPGCPPVDCAVRLVVKPRGKAAKRLGSRPLATRSFELGESRGARVALRPGPAIRRKLKRSGLERLLVRTRAVARYGDGETLTAARNMRIGG